MPTPPRRPPPRPQQQGQRPPQRPSQRPAAAPQRPPQRPQQAQGNRQPQAAQRPAQRPPQRPAQGGGRPQFTRNQQGRRPYPGLDPETVKHNAERSNQYDGIFKRQIDQFNPKVGTNVTRVLPGEFPGRHWGYKVKVHKYVNGRGTYLCLKEMGISNHCPLCDLAAELKRRGGTDDNDKPKFASDAVIDWVIDRNGDQGLPQIYVFGTYANQDISTIIQTVRGSIVEFTHPDTGRDLIFTRTGTKEHTRYSGWRLDMEESPISTNRSLQFKLENWAYENPIEDLLLFRDEAYLEQVAYGASEERDATLDDNNPDVYGASAEYGGGGSEGYNGEEGDQPPFDEGEGDEVAYGEGGDEQPYDPETGEYTEEETGYEDQGGYEDDGSSEEGGYGEEGGYDETPAEEEGDGAYGDDYNEEQAEQTAPRLRPRAASGAGKPGGGGGRSGPARGPAPTKAPARLPPKKITRR